jgi:pimeloyl-ACP methyl ester carboxylesterase
VPTVDEVTEVLSTILKRSGIRRAALIGHSYGAWVATAMRESQLPLLRGAVAVASSSDLLKRCGA